MNDDRRGTFTSLARLVHFRGVKGSLIQAFPFLVRDILPGLQTAVGSVEGDAPALEGRIGRQRVIDNHLVGVFDLRRHLVVYIDLRPEKTIVADVAIVLFMVCI